MLPITTARTMTSLEIAGLVESKHEKVRQSIERLANRGVIQLPPTGKVEDKQSNSPNNKTKVYIFSSDRKRDTYVVVAQLSPEFTARVVDRWQQLETETRKPALPDFTNPVAAARAWADTKESEQKALAKLEAAQPAIEFQQRVANADDCHTIDAVAKILRTGPRKLRRWMREQKILRLDGLPSAQAMNAGYFRVIEKPIQLPFGHKLHQQVLVTGKGLQWLQRRMDHSLMGVDV